MAMDLNTFLGHSTNDDSDFKSSYLSGKWRKQTVVNQHGKKEAHLDVWLHTKAVFEALWRHNWHKIYERRDGTKSLGPNNLRCLEDESTLRRQFFRNRETGKREAPPKICPVCLMIEQVRELVDSGRLKPTTVLFKFVNGDKLVELHAAGLYNGFKNASEALKAECKAAGFYLSESYKENLMASCSYAFPVVVEGKTDDGVIISVEKKSLGDAVKRVLGNEIESRGDEGNPMLHPYALRWKYYPEESNPNAMYDCATMHKIQLSEEVRHLIVDTDPPTESIQKLLAYPNMKALRAQMEDHCTVELDWDSIFGPVERLCDAEGNYVKPVGDVPNPVKPKPSKTLADTPTAKTASRRQAAPAPEPPPQPSVNMIPCDDCGTDMREDQEVCTKCGKKYEFVSDEEIPF